MILQRTYILYLLATIILFNITNFQIVHARRINKLGEISDSFSGNNINVTINYWNYSLRLHPNNLSALKNLSYYYLLAKDYARARETINSTLCIAPLDDNDRPEYLKDYIILTGNSKIYCKDRLIRGLFSGSLGLNK